MTECRKDGEKHSAITGVEVMTR